MITQSPAPLLILPLPYSRGTLVPVLGSRGCSLSSNRQQPQVLGGG